MKILVALKSGLFRSLHSWKGVLIQWIVSLIMASFIAVPMKGIINSGFRSSMITERFLNGFNFEAIRDFGPVFTALIAFLGTGILFLFFVNFLSNAFITGGLFESVRNTEENDSEPNFWHACASNFVSFLFIQLFTGIIIILLGLIITGIPALIVSTGKGISETTVFQVIITASSVFVLILPVFLLVADYSRSWLISNQNESFLKAIGFGFRQTFRTFGTSWLLMALIILLQIIFLGICFLLVSGLYPSTGSGVFGFFLITQLIFIFRIFLRVARYGSVTSLMEQNTSLLYGKDRVTTF